MKEDQVFNNISFLSKINPRRTIIVSFLVWFFLFLTAPLVINIEINYFSYLFIFFSVLAFILGGLLNKKPKINYNKKYITSDKKIKKLFKIIIILALIGLLAKIIDRFFIRGISVDADFLANRENSEQSGGNPVAILASFFVPFGIFPLFLYWRYKINLNLLMKIFVFVLFFFQLFDALLLGARSIIFVFFVLFFLFVLFFKKFVFTIRNTIILIGIILSFLLIMNYIFLERTKLFAGDNAYSIALSQSNFNYTLTSKQEFKQTFEKLSPINQTIAFTYITTTQYFTHGMFEFSYLFDNFNKEHALGKYTFNVYFRFIYKFTGTEFNSNEIVTLAPRQGIYTSFFGPIFIDFGWFTLLFMFIFGFYSNSIYEKAKQGIDWAILMHFFIFIVLMFSPVFNFINGAGGIFIFTSILVFSFLSRRFYTLKATS